MKTGKQKGFTLIELVVVIALLGILAAFAIPRFASLEREARSAVTQGLSGSVRSAAAMAHGLNLATGLTTVNMEGNNIDIVNGYPDAETIALTLADSTGFAVSDDGTTTTFDKVGTTANCMVEYTEAGAATPPTILATTTGC